MTFMLAKITLTQPAQWGSAFLLHEYAEDTVTSEHHECVTGRFRFDNEGSARSREGFTQNAPRADSDPAVAQRPEDRNQDHDQQEDGYPETDRSLPQERQ